MKELLDLSISLLAHHWWMHCSRTEKFSSSCEPSVVHLEISIFIYCSNMLLELLCRGQSWGLFQFIHTTTLWVRIGYEKVTGPGIPIKLYCWVGVCIAHFYLGCVYSVSSLCTTVWGWAETFWSLHVLIAVPSEFSGHVYPSVGDIGYAGYMSQSPDCPASVGDWDPQNWTHHFESDRKNLSMWASCSFMNLRAHVRKWLSREETFNRVLLRRKRVWTWFLVPFPLEDWSLHGGPS